MQSEKSLPFLDCDIKNEQKSFQCIQRFLASKSNCTFPWLEKYSKEGLEHCNKDSELHEHIKTYLRILQRKMDPELKAFGCLRENCVINKWKAERYTHMTYEQIQESPFYRTFAENGKTGIILTMISDEVLFYSYENRLWGHFMLARLMVSITIALMQTVAKCLQ